MNPDTRPSLILRLGDRADDAAWAEFMEIYEPILFRLASRWGLQDADAREVVQETLLAVANAIPLARESGSQFCRSLTLRVEHDFGVLKRFARLGEASYKNLQPLRQASSSGTMLRTTLDTMTVT